MEGSIQLTDDERKMLLKVYRYADDVRRSRRAHVLLLLADGLSYRALRRLLFASNDLIAACVAHFRTGGVAAALDSEVSQDRERDQQTRDRSWMTQLRQWVLTKTPRDFGYFRTRWSCDALSEVLWWEAGVRKSAESVRCALREMNFVWRRPRPILKLRDPAHAAKLSRIQALLAKLPTNEVAVFQDEVDVNLNPKIGSTWMVCGQQATVTTPGNNEKRYLAGSLSWRTGTLLVSDPAPRRDTHLFLDHLDDLRRHFRGYRKIHVICDNAGFHKSRAVQHYLARWPHRLQLHFLPTYAPETNPIERVWWHLHETITRNHRCSSLDELLHEVLTWFRQHHNYYHEIPTLYQLAA